MRRIILISGRICTGKTRLAENLKKHFGFHIISSKAVLLGIARSKRKKTDRVSLQKLGDEKDKESKSDWLKRYVKDFAKKKIDAVDIVVDNIRTGAQLESFRKETKFNIVHIHLYARTDELQRRFDKKIKNSPNEKAKSYLQADLIKNDEDIDEFKKDADVRINTSRTDGIDTLVRVAARLGLYSPPDVRCVDVVVGGQYGSEGKGHIAAYLARNYDVLVRVGGPNAGHTVSSSSGVYTYHQLPSGAKDTDAKLLLGPGMTIYVPDLLNEIRECAVGPNRLYIDPQAMIIEDTDRESETKLVKSIASTGRGGGAAAARRILQRGLNTVRLAKDIPELEPYVGKMSPYRGATLSNLEQAYRSGASILLEGTQGSGLSLIHGSYPHVTSRDTNVAGCLAEAGISPSRVRRILMVVRSTPIRVDNPEDPEKTSGPLKNETTFEQIAAEASLLPDELRENEKTSTTKRKRRVGWFEWEQFRAACAINAPTDIVLTFADYLSSKNREARRFEQLQEDTIKFIEELERVAQAPVSLINTRFPRSISEKLDLRTVIDRRNWATLRRNRTGH